MHVHIHIYLEKLQSRPCDRADSAREMSLCNSPKHCKNTVFSILSSPLQLSRPLQQSKTLQKHGVFNTFRPFTIVQTTAAVQNTAKTLCFQYFQILYNCPDHCNRPKHCKKTLCSQYFQALYNCPDHCNSPKHYKHIVFSILSGPVQTTATVQNMAKTQSNTTDKAHCH